jgi:hypothetical protein
VVEVELAVGFPRPRQLQFVEYAEFHRSALSPE